MSWFTIEEFKCWNCGEWFVDDEYMKDACPKCGSKGDEK